MSARISVLHYLGSKDDRGGIVSILRTLAATDAFDCALGVSPGFSQERTPPLPSVEFPGIEPEHLGIATCWRVPPVAAAVREWLNAGPNRVFHGHTRAGLAAALKLRRLGEKRVVVTVHCYGRHRWFYRLAARQLGASLHWLSPAMREYYGVAGEGWDDCLPGCVPEGRRAGGPERRSDGVLAIGGIGALVPWKRWDLALDALDRLPAEERRRITFRHIGGGAGPQADALRARAPGSFLGEQPSSAKLLSEIDCLVIASDREPFSIAMLEALAAGVPVLAADSGGAKDVIRPPVNGWLFKSGDSSDLAARISDLLQPGAVKNIRIDAAVLARFSAGQSAAAHLAAYDRVLRSG